MRQVYNNSMVAHLWAHQSQDAARTATGSFYFSGDTIYSYGSHFPIARIVKRRGRTVVLFTTQNYSVTTSGHKSMALRACSHLRVFHVPDVRSSRPRVCFESYRRRLIECQLRFARARTNKPYIFSQMQDLAKEANEFAELFGLKSRLTIGGEEDMAKESAALRRRYDKKRDQEREKRERAIAEWREQVENKLEEWTRGGDLSYSEFYGLPTRLRIKDSKLETSLGAEVPLEHAIKCYRILKKLRQRHETYQHNGHTIHLGHFRLDSLDENGTVRAGCHEVAWEEIERVAKIAGVA